MPSFFTVLAAAAAAALVLAGGAAADTATSASGPNAAAFATDFTNSSFVKTGRRLAQDPSLATAATGGGVAFAGGDGKFIGSSGAAGVRCCWRVFFFFFFFPRTHKARDSPLSHLSSLSLSLPHPQPCKNTATSGPGAFAWTSGPGGPSIPFISWGPRGAGQAAPSPLTVCPGSVIQFLWDGASPPRGVTQISSDSCPQKFGEGEQGQKVIAAPAASGNVGVRVTKPGKLYFADPGNCAATIMTVDVLKP
jgi:hypothetical protein